MPITEKQTVCVNSGFAHPADTTKQVQFDMSGITANSPAVVTVPNASGTMALTGTKLGSFTYDVSTASGTTVVTGVGFTPACVELEFGNSSGAGRPVSHGWDTGTQAYCRYSNTVNVSEESMIDTNSSIRFQGATGNDVQGSISALGADGFTISWTKTGAPSGTIAVMWRASRV